jgi:CIC family chloride channel protein
MFPILFACVSIVGVCLADTLGTGHALVDKLFQTHTVWYLLLLVFLIRAVFVMVSNTAGVTGGLFLPTLAFGAILGSLCAEGMIAVGLLEPHHYILMVVLGITAFLGATSQIPLTACVFAVETLCGINNVLTVIIATTVAFLIAKLSRTEDITDAVIKAKEHSARGEIEPTVIVDSFTVNERSFVAGKELRDILLPNSCVVVSIERAHESHGSEKIHLGDVITVRYKTYNPAATAEELSILIGNQFEQIQHNIIS